jgi:hypothetical protein
MLFSRVAIQDWNRERALYQAAAEEELETRESIAACDCVRTVRAGAVIPGHQRLCSSSVAGLAKQPRTRLLWGSWGVMSLSQVAIHEVDQGIQLIRGFCLGDGQPIDAIG